MEDVATMELGDVQQPFWLRKTKHFCYRIRKNIKNSSLNDTNFAFWVWKTNKKMQIVKWESFFIRKIEILISF